jgi:MerR family transcriptional regulator, heat shock protein HspR
VKYYGINAVAHELQVHPSSLRRWEENDLIRPERVVMGKTTVRIYDEELMRMLRRAKDLINSGTITVEAFERARAEIEQEEIEREEIEREEQHNDCHRNHCETQ